jgi:hypothetical protein
MTTKHTGKWMISGQTRREDTAAALLLLSAPVLRLVKALTGFDAGLNLYIFFAYSAAILIWLVSLQRRLIHDSVRKYLIGIAVLLLIYMAVRTAKYSFLVSRLLWYLYYGVYCFVPLMGFFAVSYLGMPPDYRPPRARDLLYLPAAVLTVLVLTNDRHQLAFRFQGPMSQWSDAVGTPGPVYYLVLAWGVAIGAASIVTAAKRCRVADIRRRIWVPAGILAGGLTLSLIRNLSPVLVGRIFVVPEILTATILASTESMVLLRLFPSNDSYQDFWRMSGLGMGIMDESGKFYFSTTDDPQIVPEDIRRAVDQPVPLHDGDIELHSLPVSGGWAYWLTDVSRVHRLNRQLQEQREILESEHELLQAENQLKQQALQVQQEEALYTEIASFVRPQNEKLQQLLDHQPRGEEAFREMLKNNCYLNVYIKRCANLILLMHQRDGTVEVSELFLAIRESLEYVLLAGVPATNELKGEGRIAGSLALEAYAFLERLLEKEVPGTGAILIQGALADGRLALDIELASPAALCAAEELVCPGCRITLQQEPGVQVIGLREEGVQA